MTAHRGHTIWRPWSVAARLRERGARRRTPPREELIRRHAPGRSFIDVGAMWSVHGRIAFLAEECRATAVTALDLMPASGPFEAEHRRRRSNVRFIQGDLHDPDVIEAAGPHEVVWCSGVLYHSPNPLLTLERLRALTASTLILATETMPEVPGLAQACVFLPGLEHGDRAVHAAARPHTTAHGVHTKFDRNQGYGAWWWGITRSALRAMLEASGFTIIEELGGPLHATVVAASAGGSPATGHRIAA